jgi:CBS domain containing-hemolysin-like protein
VPEWLGLVLTVFLLLGNGFFVAAEFAIVAARRSVLEPEADRGSRRARTTIRAMEHVSVMMAGAQLGITVCSLALGALSEPAIAHLLEPAFHAVHLPDGAVHPIAFAIALALVTVLHVVIGEMVAKNVALAGPERAALWLAPPLVAVVTAFRPLISALNVMANSLIRLLGVTPKNEVASAFTRDEVAGMVAESHREGHLDEDEHELLTGAIGFATKVADDVLLPVATLVRVPTTVTPDELEALAVSTGYSRFPLDDLTGYLHVKDVLTVPERGSAVPGAMVRPLPTVTGTTPLRSVLETMRTSGSHLVRVGDAGVAAMEDALEELIGEVRATGS